MLDNLTLNIPSTINQVIKNVRSRFRTFYYYIGASFVVNLRLFGSNLWRFQPSKGFWFNFYLGMDT